MPEPIETLRSFIAIHLPPHVKERLAEIRRQLEQSLPRDTVRWTALDQIHLTLQFLGNVAQPDLATIEASLAQIAAVLRPFVVSAEGLGAFPSARQPRILWVGVNGDLAALRALQKSIAAITAPWCAREEDREYLPHLTLGRVREAKSRVGRMIRDALAKANAGNLGEWTAADFALMASELSPEGARHSVLASFRLLGEKT
jgi:2'-5' RNA ligase